MVVKNIDNNRKLYYDGHRGEQKAPAAFGKMGDKVMKQSVMRDLAGLLAGLVGFVVLGNMDPANIYALVNLVLGGVLFLVCGRLLRVQLVQVHTKGRTKASRPARVVQKAGPGAEKLAKPLCAASRRAA